MENNSLQVTYKRLSANKLFVTTFFGLVIRLAMLVFILTIGLDFSDPYFIEDDIKYENLAMLYRNNAASMFDFNYFDKITTGYMQLFWPFICCLLAYITKYIYASRFLNVIMSSLCIPIIYKILSQISDDEKVAHRGAKIFAYLPITVMTCCFPIKDVYIMMSVLYAFYVFLRIQKGKRVGIRRSVLCILLMTGVYFARGAVTELMICFFAIFLIQRFAKKKNHLAVLACIVAVGLGAVLLGNSIVDAFSLKVDHYHNYDDVSGGLSYLTINSIFDIYKLPFTYFFATLQPFRLNYFNEINVSFWSNIMAYFNITIYPVAIGNLIYLFMKKKNFFFWLATFVIYTSVIILSIGVFRHYLFLIPIEMINYSLYTEKDSKNKMVLSILLSLVIFMGIFFLSVI